MKIKVGDNVKVIAGSDKGKTGKVTRVLRKDNRVVVEGVHMVHKHLKPRRTGDVGSIIEIEAPIHASNVKLAEEVKATKSTKNTKTKKESEK